MAELAQNAASNLRRIRGTQCAVPIDVLPLSADVEVPTPPLAHKRLQHNDCGNQTQTESNSDNGLQTNRASRQPMIICPFHCVGEMEMPERYKGISWRIAPALHTKCALSESNNRKWLSRPMLHCSRQWTVFEYL